MSFCIFKTIPPLGVRSSCLLCTWVALPAGKSIRFLFALDELNGIEQAISVGSTPSKKGSSFGSASDSVLCLLRIFHTMEEEKLPNISAEIAHCEEWLTVEGFSVSFLATTG